MAEESTTYQVKADLVLEVARAKRNATQMQQKIQDLGRRIKGTSSLAGGLTRNLIAVGGAYLGISVLSRAFMGATRSAMTYTSELEKTQIALTSILAAVQGTEWSQAQKTAGRVFEQVRTDSIKSVATAQELFTIYQGIVGPIIAAGHGLEKVRTITRDTVNAAGVLGVDLAQAQRDISMMARGTAGMDVKLFSMLRSTGAIAETTEEWNKSLTGAERIDKLADALAKFAPAGERFAKSWAGVTSTFKGIRQEFTRSAMSPIMDAMAGSLLRINSILIDNQEVIQVRLRKWGVSFAERLGTVFAKAEKGILMVATRWDEVLAKIAKMQQMLGKVGKVAAVGAAAQLARPALGAAVGGVGALAAMSAPGAAAAATGGAAGGAAAGGAAGAALIGLGPALAIVAGGAAILAGVILAVREQMIPLNAMFLSMRPIMLGLWEVTQRLGLAVGAFLTPILKALGNMMLAPLVSAFTVTLAVVRTLVGGLAIFFEGLAMVTNFIYDTVSPVFDFLFKALDRFVTGVMGIVNFFTGDTLRYNQRKIMGTQEDPLVELGKRFAKGDYVPPWAKENFQDAPVGSTVRAMTVNDFRGSKIEVKQTFRDADPDRVMIAMVDGLARQAEMRIQSGMVPALGR